MDWTVRAVAGRVREPAQSQSRARPSEGAGADGTHQKGHASINHSEGRDQPMSDESGRMSDESGRGACGQRQSHGSPPTEESAQKPKNLDPIALTHFEKI